MTARVSPPSFSYLDCIRRAEETLSQPPRWPWARRVDPRGDLVAQFALPLSLCPTSNQRMRGGIKQRFAEAAMKKTALKMMESQLLLQMNPVRTLSGRPQVIATRFSSREADKTSDWSKVPVDVLVKLRLIRDDAPKHAEIVTECDYAPPQKGFVLVRVYTGEER